MADAKQMIADMKAAAEVEVQKYVDLSAALDLDLKAAEDKGFDLGVAQAGIPAGDKLYTEADLVAEKAILQAQIDAKQVELDGVDAKLADAVKAKGLEIAAKIRDASVDDLAIAAELEA